MVNNEGVPDRYYMVASVSAAALGLIGFLVGAPLDEFGLILAAFGLCSTSIISFARTSLKSQMFGLTIGLGFLLILSIRETLAGGLPFFNMVSLSFLIQIAVLVRKLRQASPIEEEKGA